MYPGVTHSLISVDSHSSLAGGPDREFEKAIMGGKRGKAPQHKQRGGDQKRKKV